VHRRGIVGDRQVGVGRTGERNDAVELRRRDAAEGQRALQRRIIAEQFALFTTGDDDDPAVPRQTVNGDVVAGDDHLGKAAVRKPHQLAATRKPFRPGGLVEENRGGRVVGLVGGRPGFVGLGGLLAIDDPHVTGPGAERDRSIKAARPRQQVADLGVAILGEDARSAARRRDFVDVALGGGAHDEAAIGHPQEASDIAVADLADHFDAARGERGVVRDLG